VCVVGCWTPGIAGAFLRKKVAARGCSDELLQSSNAEERRS